MGKLQGIDAATNRKKVQLLTEELLDTAMVYMKKNVVTATECGALDMLSWSEDNNPMIIPKIIAIAVLEAEADQYKAMGTSFEKEIKKEAKNLRHFI